MPSGEHAVKARWHHLLQVWKQLAWWCQAHSRQNPVMQLTSGCIHQVFPPLSHPSPAQGLDYLQALESHGESSIRLPGPLG